jgi:hypothetical protein
MSLYYFSVKPNIKYTAKMENKYRSNIEFFVTDDIYEGNLIDSSNLSKRCRERFFSLSHSECYFTTNKEMIAVVVSGIGTFDLTMLEGGGEIIEDEGIYSEPVFIGSPPVEWLGTANSTSYYYFDAAAKSEYRISYESAENPVLVMVYNYNGSAGSSHSCNSSFFTTIVFSGTCELIGRDEPYRIILEVSVPNGSDGAKYQLLVEEL